ncbi:hypothetical protein V1498_18825 [Peribacillus sp. SCS-26]|uniref:hypothetical protein n=1 Tax=Paraperibacillus marinus TaxID=3115295 RepID=UPI0039061A93
MKKTLAVGLGVLGLCALCCALPILRITGIGGIVGLRFGFWNWGVLFIATALSGFLILKIVKKNGTCNARADCNCSSNTCKHS